tara:strand:+ start:150 stop:1823 length:1674 start_codon:yes stop_codon:yes gene_type:complete
MAVPKQLVPIIGKTAIKRSLKTADLAQAKLRFSKHLEETLQQFELAKLKLSNDSSIELNVRDCAIIAERWYKYTKDRLEASGSFSDYVTFYPVNLGDERIRTYGSMSLHFPHFNEGIESATLEQLNELAEFLDDEITGQLDREKLTVPLDSDSFRRLAVAFRSYTYRIEELCIARQNDDWNKEPVNLSIYNSELSSSKGKLSPPCLGNKFQPVKSTQNTLSSVLKKYVKSETIKHKGALSRTKTLSETSLKVEYFIDIFGDMDIAEISRPHIVEYRDALYQLPKSKKQSIRDKSIPEQIEYAKANNLTLLSSATVKNSLRKLSPVFTYAIEIGLISVNPMIGVRINQAEKKIEVGADKGYSERDIRQLFKHDIFTNKDATKAYGLACYWIPLLCRYTGARLNEMAQLHKSDVKISENGVFYLNIRRGEGQFVKSDSSLRYVPIPKHLEKLGFIDYVEATTGLLFPELPLCKYGKRSTAFSKWWSRIVKQVGITTDQPSHSFRHSFKTAMRSLGVADSVSDAITGHAAKTEGERYGTVTLDTKKEAIDRLLCLDIKRL